MAPRRLQEKSQEHVYKLVGQGGRARYKPIPVHVPPIQGANPPASSSTGSKAAKPSVAPPASSTDNPGHHDDIHFNEGETEFEIPRRKGKVRNHYFNGMTYSYYSCCKEAGGLHEGLAQRKKNEVCSQNS
jgi:hypothetical protein